MAKCNNIFGLLSGPLGSYSYSSWKGKQVVRLRRSTRNVPPSQNQLQHRAKFLLVTKFVGSLSGLLVHTFKDTRTMTALNVAFRHNYQYALSGSYPAFVLDYEKVLISLGELWQAERPSVEVINKEIKFSWTNNSGNSRSDPDDKCILVLYCPDTKKAIYKLDGAARSVGSDSIDATVFSGMAVETWLAFISENGKKVSRSQYTGHLLIP